MKTAKAKLFLIRPNPDAEYYLENGKYKGYKFYKHGINGIQPKGNMLCEFVAKI